MCREGRAGGDLSFFFSSGQSQIATVSTFMKCLLYSGPPFFCGIKAGEHFTGLSNVKLNGTAHEKENAKWAQCEKCVSADCKGNLEKPVWEAHSGPEQKKKKKKRRAREKKRTFQAASADGPYRTFKALASCLRTFSVPRCFPNLFHLIGKFNFVIEIWPFWVTF